MTLVGYALGSKGYQLWNKSTQAIILSCDMTFDEHSFPFRESGQLSTLPVQPTVPLRPITIELPESREAPPPTPATPVPISNRDNTVFFTPPLQPPVLMLPTYVCACPIWVNAGIPSPSFGPCPPSPWQLCENPHPNPRYFRLDNTACMRQTEQLGQMALLATATVKYHNPATYQEVLASEQADEWHDACQYEMNALAKNGTWTLVDLPPGRKAVKSKWVFK